MMTWKQTADEFLEFFRGHGHTIVPSASLVPANDPTLLFTNAGMVQFKDIFLGAERRPYVRAATLQKIMRVHGKHNDLENVGPSPWHHTFFFMLGNFSFGDYFKDDAIAYAWELMTRRYAIERDRLVITVLQGDDEAEGAWRKLGIPTERLLLLGEETNFWMMGDVGPCGPTSELHFDWGSEYCTCKQPDCSVALDNGCLRWLETWNLVFMQFDQRPDGTRVRLPKPGVDTGMGLERITSVLQGVHDDYRTDIFDPLMGRVRDLVGDQTVPARVMADHSRAMTFLMADGIVPGNEGRGYVLRMIMRRAMRFARSTGVTKPFLGDLADVVIGQMGNAFPELKRQRSFIMEAARVEETRFAQTLTHGLTRLEEVIATVRSRGENVVPGDDVFRLYDTYGFPFEMTRDIAGEHGLEIDEAGFAAAMESQRRRARAASAFETTDAEGQRFGELEDEGISTEFVGYRKGRARAKVLALFAGGRRVDEASAGTEVEVILDRTPFYAEAGGQVGDTGRLRASRVEVDVLDTQRPLGAVISHRGRITRGRLRVGMPITAEVDVARRLDTMRNHTATHLLHKALQELLEEHARQAGSLVAPDRLRFDFVHLSALTEEQREAIERRVNEKVLDDLPVVAKWMSYDEATKLGAMALFGEKYGDRVRVIGIDAYSRELCGGTHVNRTGQIGMFKITSESGVAAGVRRIEAVTGPGVYALLRKHDSTLRVLADQLRISPDEVPDRVRRLLERVKELERQVRSGTATGDGPKELLSRALDGAVDVSGLRFVAAAVPAGDTETIRRLADQIRDRLDADRQPGVVVLASPATGQVVATRTRKTPAAVDVGRLVRSLTEAFGGSGGGRPEFAQGGLKDGGRVQDLIALARDRTFLERVIQS
ncbi:MAG: alanine--tRNA ligase [bacterium]